MTALAIPLLLLLSAATQASRGFVASKVWIWFIVPAGIRPISWLVFAGVSILMGLLRPSPPNEYTPTKSDMAKTLLSPWVTLGIAWMLMWVSQ